MLGEVIGEFEGKNTGWRVLPDGKIETTAQGTGNILKIEAFRVGYQRWNYGKRSFYWRSKKRIHHDEGRNSYVERRRSWLSLARAWSGNNKPFSYTE